MTVEGVILERCPPYEKRCLWFLSLSGDTSFHGFASLSGLVMQARCAFRGCVDTKKDTKAPASGFPSAPTVPTSKRKDILPTGRPLISGCTGTMSDGTC